MSVKPPTHSTAELIAELNAEWINYELAWKEGDQGKADEIKKRIMDIQNQLDVKTTEQDFQQQRV